MSESKIMEESIKDQIIKLESVREEYREFSRIHAGYIQRINGIDLQIEALGDVLSKKDTSISWKANLEIDKLEEERKK